MGGATGGAAGGAAKWRYSRDTLLAMVHWGLRAASTVSSCCTISHEAPVVKGEETKGPRGSGCRLSSVHGIVISVFLLLYAVCYILSY